MGEVLLTHVWEALKIETSRSPDIEVFKRFRDKGFPATPYTTAQLHTRDPQELGEFAITQAAKLKVLIDSIREVEANPRGDYKELLDLMEAYIGLNEERFQFLGCGAVHKARWMGKQLYCYKIVMLQEYIPQGIASKSQLQKISRFVDFCTFAFNSWWFLLSSCSISTAPGSGTRQEHQELC